MRDYSDLPLSRDVLEQRFFADSKSLPKKGLGLGIIAGINIHACKVVETRGCVGMFGTEHLLPDLESFLKEWLGSGVIAHAVIENSQAIDACGGEGMVLP